MNEVKALLEQQDKAVLVAVNTPKLTINKTNEYLDELEFLASTLNIQTLARFVQKLERPDSSTFVGKGKLEEIMLYVHEHEVDIIIFDDDLTPSQVRNLERVVKCRIYDRSLLILDIFLYRAQTAQARTQVELARHQYMLPRLTRLWSHLERQRGGTGTRGGAGEKEIETDRRIIRDKISLLRDRLNLIERQGETRRKNRKGVARVSLVGYTNVGKSTLMRTLAKTDVFAENKLFATVDSTVRKVTLEGVPFLLTDTVGFIRKLPHTLIECFKSTLDEIREADILVHVVDLSHPSFEEHIEVVNTTLSELGAGDKPTVLVLNKIDQYLSEHEPDIKSITEGIAHLENTYLLASENTVFISASKQVGMEKLRNKILNEVRQVYVKMYPNTVPNNLYFDIKDL